MEKMIDISDENIRLHTLCKENEETYLCLQRHASLLTPLYEKKLVFSIKQVLFPKSLL